MIRWISASMGACLIFGLTTGPAGAQSPPAIPEKALPDIRSDTPLPPRPAEQFDACANAKDRAAREACITRQTTINNPATRSSHDSRDKLDVKPKSDPK